MNDKINGFLVTLPMAKLVNPADFSSVVAPSSLNYTALGYVTAVRNQVNCFQTFLQLNQFYLKFSFRGFVGRAGASGFFYFQFYFKSAVLLTHF